MTFYIGNDLLARFESEIRKYHVNLIINICHDVFKKPELTMKMISKYLQKHENSNLRETIRPPRIKYPDCNCEFEEDCQCTTETYTTTDTEDNIEDIDDNIADIDDIEDNIKINNNQCCYMVHYKKERQCKNNAVGISDFCGIHCNKTVYPFGIKDKNTPNIINPTRHIEDSDSDSDSELDSS